jgi:hypothetical protein
MTPRTPQCKVFWALLSNSKHSGVPEDSKSPTLEVLGFTPTLGQSGVATILVVGYDSYMDFIRSMGLVLSIKINFIHGYRLLGVMFCPS